jgi:type VI secretion system protein ImpH
VGLAGVLSDRFGVPVRVEQFRGKWLRLDEHDRSRLGCGPGKDGYCSLGRSLVLGRRVWEVQSSFRVRLGPMDCDQFRRFLPRSEGLPLVGQLTRLYAGAEFDFDVQLVLKKEEVPPCRLGGGSLPRLGWTTWLQTSELSEDPSEVILAVTN